MQIDQRSYKLEEMQPLDDLSGDRQKQDAPISPSPSSMLDTGFRVLKIGDSNFKDCRLPPDAYKPEDLEEMADNLLPKRKPLDLLIEAMLMLGLDWNLPLQTQTIQNKQVFFVGDNQAIACFEEGLAEDLAKSLASDKPRRVVFLDGVFASDAVRINIERLFQLLSPPATHITIL